MENRVTKSCRWCGKNFTLPKCREWRNHFCSSECGKAERTALSEQLLRKCPGCGIEFKTRRTVEIKHCSVKCAGLLRRGVPQSEEWAANRLESYIRNGNVERQRKRRGPNNPLFMGRIIRGGYVYIWVKRRGYLAEHRYMMEQKLGRRLKPNEIVHHVNELKTDNRIDNLTIVSRAEHASIHCNQRTRLGRFAHKQS